MGNKTAKLNIGSQLSRFLQVTALAVLLFGCFAQAAAEEQLEEESNQVRIYSENLDPIDLPDPGEPITISAQLLNTRDTTSPMKALAVIDGKLIELPAAKSFLNKYDFPEYHFELNAPVAQLNYHFVLLEKSGEAIFSERFEVRRECSPDIEKVNPEISPKAVGKEKLNQLIQKSNALYREASLYNRSLIILADIKKLLEE